MIRHALLIALLISAGCSRNPAPPPKAEASSSGAPQVAPLEVALDERAQREASIEIQKAGVRSRPESIQASGRITVNEERTWRIGAVTNGRVVSILANAGDAVKQGQVLARLHSHEVHESRAEYQKALAELARLKSAVSYAQRAHDRARRLFDLKAASLEQVEHSEAELRNARAALGNAEVEVNRTRAHLVEFLDVAADDTDTRAGGHDQIPIRAPASGTLLARNITPGTVVQPSNELFVVTDLTALWMIASVNEEYLAKLRTGLAAHVEVQAFPGRAFPGRITKLGEELDATTRTLRVRIELPNRPGQLKPEMYATATIELGGSVPALYVPQEAVQVIAGRPAVFVRTAPGRFEVRPVRTGRALESYIEISSGLKQGDEIATRGSFVLKSQLMKGTSGE
jgi:cobalt-zinc-cadmium efflux system membrane fusion protein